LITLTCKAPEDARASVRTFVQDFYTWYVPRARDDSAAAMNGVLRARSDALAPELAAALKEDLAAQEKASGEIVGLDFDPFLASQDPCERYEVGEVKAQGSRYRVAIHGVCSGTRSSQPEVTAEVAKQNDRWTIVNLHYAEGADLSSQLKLLRDARDRER
jgi:hypothetical protein